MKTYLALTLLTLICIMSCGGNNATTELMHDEGDEESSTQFTKAHVKRKCKTRIEIVGAGSPRPQSVRVGGPNPYEDSVAVARFLNINQYSL